MSAVGTKLLKQFGAAGFQAKKRAEQNLV